MSEDSVPFGERSSVSATRLYLVLKAVWVRRLPERLTRPLLKIGVNTLGDLSKLEGIHP